jgi:hypothetical protein
MPPHKKGHAQGPMLKHISKEKGLKKIKENMKGGNKRCRGGNSKPSSLLEGLQVQKMKTPS